MVKNVALIVVVAAVLLLFYRFIGVAPVATFSVGTPIPHYYDRPAIPIAHIDVLVLYFVPKDRVQTADPNWRNLLTKPLEEITAFHDLELQGKSKLTFTYLPEIVVGQEKGSFYEVPSVTHTDPLSIAPVVDELSTRLLSPTGDLWQYEKEYKKTDARRVYIILFEGEGAAG